LRLEGIEKEIMRKKILQDIYIKVKEQSFTAILGPVGAGKTTLLKIIAGTVKPTKGKIFLRGKDITRLPPQKRKVAMVFQAFSLYPNLTVYENMASPLRAARKSESEIKKKVKRQAEILGITSLLDKHPYELSGGESQRVAIGILTAKGFEGTILYATPEYEEALSMSDETVLLKDGRVIWAGPTLESYLTPPCIAFAKNFPSPPMNLFECELIEEAGELYLSASEEIRLNVTHLKNVLRENGYILGLQPHDLHVEKSSKEMIPITFNLTLAEVTPSGTVLHLKHKEKKVSGYLSHPQDFKEKSLQLFVYPQDFFIFNKKSGKLVTKYRSANNGED